ncbi:hypothetical protein FA95DRAFT_1576373 [Auriscalpium vulgare]|uniref:Uncharacterized protein n=1 Tax=Auriscalpium vulgare TaxID=40419 RepID=A0ACB8RBC2_9AGAM|nr:hypothetical protein FA95DRAFT_1576373 [Auriscalpium vulgare]
MSFTPIAMNTDCIETFASSFPVNPDTGLRETEDMKRYIFENPDCPDVRRFWTSTAASPPLSKDAYAALAPQILPRSAWLVLMNEFGAAGSLNPAQWALPPDLRGNNYTKLTCCDAGTRAMRFEQDFFHDEPLSSDTVLLFVKRCIATPVAPQQPALPASMFFSDIYLPHAPTLAPFLDALPAPFQWQIAPLPDPAGPPPPVPTHPDNFDELVELAEQMKAAGNREYAARQRGRAVQIYTVALAGFGRAIAVKPHRVNARVRRLHAVLLANRAAAHLLEDEVGGTGADPAEALRDGRAAEKADPTYVKGYLRQARAHEMLGQVGERRAVLERALGHVHGVDALAVRNALDSES